MTVTKEDMEPSEICGDAMVLGRQSVQGVTLIQILECRPALGGGVLASAQIDTCQSESSCLNWES